MPNLAFSSPKVFEKYLRRYYFNPIPACQNILSYRNYATANSTSTFNHPVTDVAILGGGITGLATAYYLSTKLPSVKIRLFEGSSRLGGWLHSRTVNVGNGNVVFEHGPRSLRPSTPSALVTMDLISKLNLTDKVLKTHVNSVAAQNRFLYYPDHLVSMPGGSLRIKDIWTILREPVFRGLPTSLLKECFTDRRPESLMDESVGSFLARRFGPSLTDNIASALFHGIYAGDIYKLSVRSILPSLWLIEGRYRSIVGAQFKRVALPCLEDDILLPQNLKLTDMRDTSIFTLFGGLGLLADTLVAELNKNPNVKIRREAVVDMVGGSSWVPGKKIKISVSLNKAPEIQNYTNDFSHVISTIPGANLSTLVNVPPLSLTPSVTVMVVNFFFSKTELLPARGFGYLIPRSIPFSENPEFALGIIFDSDATAGLDTVPGTKLTVMLGGHWWDGWDSYPDEDQGASMARAVLKRHLGITEPPAVTLVSLQKDCIPQYTVGHDDRMAEASELLEKYEGRLRVAGNSYTGVGVNDCVRAASDVVTGLVGGTGKTGLESFVGGRKYVWIMASSGKKKA